MTHHEDERARVGLCASCRWVRRVRSSRQQVFYRCGLAESDSRFRKYPTLPVLRCEGFEPVDPADVGSTNP